MRIALITPGFSARANDWAIPALLNLARALAQRHQLHVFSQRYPPRGLYRFDNLTHHAIGGGQNFGVDSLKIWLQTGQAIIHQHKKTPFDLLHAFWADEAGFSAALAGVKIGGQLLVGLGGGELTRLPHINYGAQRFLVRRLTTRFALNRAVRVTAGSNYQLDLCRRAGVPEGKLRLAPLGVDIKQFYPLAQTPNLLISNSHTPSLIQAASLTPIKKQSLLLHILQRVKKEIPNIHLHLAGSGPGRDELVKLARYLNLSQNITWHGTIPYPQMAQFYAQGQLYVQTSHHESQGMAVLEAMACGLPVVGTPVGVAKEVACRPPHPEAVALAEQVFSVLNEPASYPHLRRQARQIVEQKFSLPVTTANFEKIYKDLL